VWYNRGKPCRSGNRAEYSTTFYQDVAVWEPWANGKHDVRNVTMSDNLEKHEDHSVSGQSEKDDIQRCIKAEIYEMEKYKWCLGVHLQHDPLIDRSLNEIYCEWIEKYAADFRRDWENRKPGESRNN
jgi:hypothetical protein